MTYFKRYHIKDILGLLLSDDPDDNDLQDAHISNDSKSIKMIDSNDYETLTKSEFDHITKILAGYDDVKDLVLTQYEKRTGTKIKTLASIDRSFYSKILEYIQSSKDALRKQ